MSECDSCDNEELLNDTIEMFAYMFKIGQYSRDITMLKLELEKLEQDEKFNDIPESFKNTIRFVRDQLTMMNLNPP